METKVNYCIRIGSPQYISPCFIDIGTGLYDLRIFCRQKKNELSGKINA